MNKRKTMSGNVDQAYDNIIRNNNNANNKVNLQNRKQHVSNFYSFNKAPDYSKLNQMNNNHLEEQNDPQKDLMKKLEPYYVNLEENININDYVDKNENRKKIQERNPPVNYNYINNMKKQQKEDYYNYNKNSDNYNKNDKKKKILKHYQSDNLEDNPNINFSGNNDNQNQNWKQKFKKINEEKKFKYYKTKYNKFISAHKINYNDDQSDYSNKVLSQSVNVDLTQPMNYNNYHNNNNHNYNRENNINFVDDYNKNYNDDYTYNDLSENSVKNQTYQNYYCPDYNNFTNESSSIVSYDSYELNKTENCAGRVKDKLSNISKYLNPSEPESVSNEYYNDDDALSADVFRGPMKNDEKHYHQNLTIKIQKKDENKKKRKSDVTGKGLKQKKEKDNKDDGCNVSTNTDLNKKIKEKKINTFRLKAKIQKNNNINQNNLNYSNHSENYSNLSNTTVFFPSKKIKIKNNNVINDNDYYHIRNRNKKRSPNIINDNNKMKSKNDNNTNYNDNITFQKESLKQSDYMKGRSPDNRFYYNNESTYSSNNNNYPIKNYYSMNPQNMHKLGNNQNRIPDNYFEDIPKDKRIKEITVNLSPKKMIPDLSNSNGNIIINNNNNNINNITPNYNFYLNNDNKINNITPNYNFDMNNNYNNQNDYNFNIMAKPKSKIESCIIKFDKPKNKNNNNKPFKLSSSFDGLKYKKKKIPTSTHINKNNNNNYNNYYETPGMNVNKNNINNFNNKNINNKLIINKNKSITKINQNMESRSLFDSIEKKMSDSDNNEIRDCCAPSPYGKREKKMDDNLLSDIYQTSVYTNYNVSDNSKKEETNPLSQSNNDSNFDNSYGKVVKVKIINDTSNDNANPNQNQYNGIINKKIYMKKTKTCNNFNSNYNIYSSQRIPTFSNIEEITKDINNKNVMPVEQSKPINNDNNNNLKINEVTPCNSYEIPKNEKKIKFTIKSFSKKKKETKEKPIISQHCFFNKIYSFYMMQPKKEQMYISKYIIKPIKKPLVSNNYISKKQYNYIYTIPASSYEYYTKFKVPKTIISPKIDIGYMTKIFIKSKEYIENKLNNITNDNITNKNIIPLNNKKINITNRPVKKRILLIRKSKKLINNSNENNNTNINNNNNDSKNNNINKNNNNNDNNITENNNKINNIFNENNDKKSNFIIYNSSGKKENKLSEKKEESSSNNLDQIENDLSKFNKSKVNDFKNDNIYFKKKNINVIKREKLLPDNKKFDNENSFTSDNDSISFNLNINKELEDNSKNSSKNNSKIFLFHKNIDNSGIKSQSNNSSMMDMNQSFLNNNLVKTSALNFSVIHNNLNHSIDNNDNELSFISNNTINIELDRNRINGFKKNKLKIRTIIRGVKKQSKYDYLKGYKKDKKLKLSEIIKKPAKTKKEIDRERKVNLIIKEDLENYLVYYKNKKDNKKKYNWSTIEQLMIKIKLDMIDIIEGYLKACDEVIYAKKYVIIANEYIKNIIQHYKYNYLTNKNFNNIHNKIFQLFLSINNIKIYDSIKFEILGKLLELLINNNIFFVNDLYFFRQSDEQTKSNIRKIIINCSIAKKTFSKMPI